MVTFWNEEGGHQWVREMDHYDTMLAPCGRRVLDAAMLAPGERVLDVGCGSGAMTLDAARAPGNAGHAVGIDLLTGAGLTNVQIEGASDPLTFGSSVDDVVAFLETDTLGRRLFTDKDPAAVRQALEAIRVVLQPYASADGVVLEGAYWVVTATKVE